MHGGLLWFINLMGKGKRVPNSAVSRPDKKSVRFGPRIQTGKPVWRFSTVDKEGPFLWPRGSKNELQIVEKLHQFDSMSWSEIVGKSHHYLSASSLSSQAKKRLEEIELDDIEGSLFSFHIGGEPRFIAYKIRDVANLLWYDPKHEVAPSSKKNT
jgi:hypothetical protein